MIVGLTGQSGAGKSTVGRMLERRGIPGFAWIDADRVAREVPAPGSECLEALVKAFSDKILLPDGALNRKALGKLVFGDPGKLRLLNETILPYIIREIDRQIAALQAEGKSFILLDAPTLFESGADSLCGLVAAVTAPYERRLERIMARDQLTLEEAKRRLNAQQPEEFYAGRADFIFCNQGNISALERQLEEFLRLANGAKD